MSQTAKYVFGSLSITDHGVKALAILILGAIISLLLPIANGQGTLQSWQYFLFGLQLLASIALVLSKDLHVTDSQTRLIALLAFQFLSTLIQLLPSTRPDLVLQTLAQASLQAALTLLMLLEGEWTTKK